MRAAPSRVVPTTVSQTARLDLLESALAPLCWDPPVGEVPLEVPELV